MKTPLNIMEQDSLRSKGIIKMNEIAYKEGNLFYAENAVSGERRVINVSNVIKESSQLLLG